jgi:hypothetical protein
MYWQIDPRQFPGNILFDEGVIFGISRPLSRRKALPYLRGKTAGYGFGSAALLVVTALGTLIPINTISFLEKIICFYSILQEHMLFPIPFLFYT